ncbi:Slam-dependent surface lipoprotein [Rodentibacter sp. Ppn85]|uniref:Slam-dependent surface lipoprotein n=1 Tax=Rodentibacter sp. Ppn85 TaxID=1908525 RepID=UPI00098654DF|nr:Slam-dependent surface lipoprotein [Rodentibacter sp. Ppn85]OOF65439.1 hypothetical protein BKL51_05730 [Rodentibacter sp. Ppn85]
MELTKISLTRFGLAALAALIVSACGSSGGGNSDNQPQQNNASNNTQTNKTSDNKTSDNKSSNNQLQQERNEKGTAIVISGSDDNVKSSASTLNHYNTTSINVDEVDIIIGFPDPDIPDWTSTIVEERKLNVCCGRYSDIRFGVSDSLNESSNGYMFYNGNPTQNMPTSGTATYSGDAIISAENIYGLDPEEDYYHGSSKFNVDFGNKTLEGSLNIPNRNLQPVKVEINAQISGNSFTGTTDSTRLSNGQVEGKFYGNNAKEMAGLAQSNDQSWNAAFGAAKQ